MKGAIETMSDFLLVVFLFVLDPLLPWKTQVDIEVDADQNGIRMDAGFQRLTRGEGWTGNLELGKWLLWGTRGSFYKDDGDGFEKEVICL